MKNACLANASKEELIELIELYCKNWLAMDGMWFQSIEKKYGMDEAMEHDANVWEKFNVLEAQKIQKMLNLPPDAGVEGLAKALQYRLYANINKDEIIVDGNKVIYRTINCRVQDARARKNMEWHPCKPVGLIEYTGFAKTIDPRFTCRCLSCFPDITDNGCACSWEFTLNE